MKAMILVICGGILMLLASCELPTKANSTAENNTEETIRGGSCCHTVTTDVCFYPITGGKDINVGCLSVTNDLENLYVSTYMCDNTYWYVAEIQMEIAATLADIPHHATGIPIPGQFRFHSGELSPYTEVYTFTVPLSQLPSSTNTYVIAVHLVAQHSETPYGEIVQEETGWSGTIPGPGPRWWYYLEYSRQRPLRGISHSDVFEADESGITVN